MLVLQDLELILLPVTIANALGLNPGSAKGADANEVPPKNININP